MKNKVCYIFAAGDFNGNFTNKENAYIIAADSGYEHLNKLNIIPDLLIGDFDTIESMPEVDNDNVITFPIEKDYTDSCLAIDEAIRRGFTDITVFGALGGKRAEHSLANIQLLVKYTKLGIKIKLSDGKYETIALYNSSVSFSEGNKGFISIFSHSDKSSGVHISGLKYTLDNATLTNTEPLGISNEFIGTNSYISVKKGTLIIIYQNNSEDNINKK